MAAVISLTARTISSLVFSLNNTDGAGVSFTFELNRAEDFASDDTIVAVVPNVPSGVSDVTLPGLPGDTPFYVRTRSSAAGALYSNTLLAATLTVPPITNYAGFSIDKSLLVVPAQMSGLRVTSSNTFVRAGFPVENLRRDDPQATFQLFTNGTPVSAFILWETSGEPIDTVAMLGTMIDDATTWDVYSAPIANDWFNADATRDVGMTMRVSPSLGRRTAYHAYHRLPRPTTNRFWRMRIQATAFSFLARNLVCGLARSSVNPSKGASVGINDMGSASRTRFGGLDRVSGWRGRSVDFEMSWLSEAEYHTKFADIPALVGKQVSVLALPNSKRNIWMNDRFAFGPLVNFRGENVAGSKHTAAVQIDSIY